MSGTLPDRDPPSKPLLLAVVGTDHHPFGRLVAWVDAWARRHPEVDVLVQRGTSPSPAVARSVQYLDHAELQSAMEAATVVVSHGGPSTIVEARRLGKLPVVVPRDPVHGEHVDAHQVRFVERLVERHLVLRAADEAALARLLDEGLADRARLQVDDSARDAAREASCRSVESAVDALLATPRRRLLRRR